LGFNIFRRNKIRSSILKTTTRDASELLPQAVVRDTISHAPPTVLATVYDTKILPGTLRQIASGIVHVQLTRVNAESVDQ